MWGYFSSGTNDKDILLENTRIEDNSAIFEFGGLEAKYDLDEDSIFIDLENFKGEIPESNLEILAHSCSVSGAVILFKHNVGSLKYFKFLNGGGLSPVNMPWLALLSRFALVHSADFHKEVNGEEYCINRIKL